MKTIFLPLIACLSLTAAAAMAGHHKSGHHDLFNGKDLTGWKGDDRFWRVEDGAIVGETTPDNPSKGNTFLIHEGGPFGDFELSFRYKVAGFNSGLQYRSRETGTHKMAGMQADFEAEWHTDKDNPDKAPFDRFSGMYFEEGGRMFMGQRSDVVVVTADPDNAGKSKSRKIASLGDPAELGSVIRRDDWNDYTIIAHGKICIHIINGRVMSIGLDEDAANFKAEGLIGLQLHGGRPMRIDVKDIKLRPIK
ncbi:MAG: DUF1080 domain-containing protein [Synoicihabitans sp.]